MKQPQRVPIETGMQPHGRVGKSMELFQMEAPVAKLAEHGPAALGAKVERQISPHYKMPGRTGLRPVRQAGGLSYSFTTGINFLLEMIRSIIPYARACSGS